MYDKGKEDKLRQVQVLVREKRLKEMRASAKCLEVSQITPLVELSS